MFRIALVFSLCMAASAMADQRTAAKTFADQQGVQMHEVTITDWKLSTGISNGQPKNAGILLLKGKQWLAVHTDDGYRFTAVTAGPDERATIHTTSFGPGLVFVEVTKATVDPIVFPGWQKVYFYSVSKGQISVVHTAESRNAEMTRTYVWEPYQRQVVEMTTVRGVSTQVRYEISGGRFVPITLKK